MSARSKRKEGKLEQSRGRWTKIQQKERLRALLDEAIASGISYKTPEQIWDEVEAAHRNHTDLDEPCPSN